jgi:hypothetical protein
MRWIFVAGVLLFLCPGSHAADGTCPNEELLRSRKSNISTEITFINDTGGSVRLYWINFEGERQLYAQIPPGQRVHQPTFVTQPWIVVDTEEQCLGVYRAARVPRTVHISGDGTEQVVQSASSPRSSENVSEYRVVGVASDDTLNLRSEADPESEILREIPHDAARIVGTGRAETAVSETWVEVIYDNEQGWVNSRYLAQLSRPIEATVPKPPSDHHVGGGADGRR